MSDRACLNPYQWLDISSPSPPGRFDVQFAQCILSWGGDKCILSIVPLEAAAEMDVELLWNSEAATLARKQTRETGRAAYCDGCPRLAGGYDPTVEAESIDWADVKPHWTHINLAYDKSCNLCCPSCRVRPDCVRPGGREYDWLQRLQANIIKPLLRNAEWAYLAGLGDPFGSPSYRRLLTELQPEDAPGLSWHIQTNGLGFTPSALADIPTRSQIKSVQFSIDAASAATYAVNRRADWELVTDNLTFAGHLRQRDEIDLLAISMVVQANNWREMEEFYRLGERHSVDIVQFNPLLYQHTFTRDEHRRRAVQEPGHADRAAFVQACRAMRDRTSPRVVIEVPRE